MHDGLKDAADIMLTNGSDFAEFLRLELKPENRAYLEIKFLDFFGVENFETIFALLDLLLNGDVHAASRIKAEGTDRLFLDALANGVADERVLHIDETYDFFFVQRDEPDWSLIRCVNFLFRSHIKPTRKIAVVTSIRNEGINILEWIAHHRALGVEDFIIYANDNDDGSSELLEILAAAKLVHVIWNSTALGRDGGSMFPVQAKAYGHACEFLAATLNFEWLLFCDIDEFLVTAALDQPRPLDDLFARLEAMPDEPAAVLFHWKCFTSQCVFHRAPGLNFERFPHFAKADHVKTLVRRDRCLAFSTSHLPRTVHGDVVLDGALQPVSAPYFRMPPVYGYGQINHYWHKSFEEFIAKHLRSRGNAKFQSFFEYWGNRRSGPSEHMPAAWIERVKAEIKTLEALPGMAAALAKIETNFAAMLADFDRDNDSQAIYRKYL
jgi:hypothetical protein